MTKPVTTTDLPERDKDKTAEQQGLFQKFDVRRTDGSDSISGKHQGCEYFIIDISHDQHAKAALLAYAESCKETHPQLSKDMINRYELHKPSMHWRARRYRGEKVDSPDEAN